MSWRARAAPYGLSQLADKLGMTVDQLKERPEIVAAAVGQMEHPKGAKYVAESFMDRLERNGGDLLKTAADYDTLTMTSPTTIGRAGDRISTIANLNVERMRPTLDHIEAVRSGAAPRVLPEGYTQNFSPAAARVQPIRNWGDVRAPDGSTVFAPSWGRPAIAAGEYVNIGGEYFVRDASDMGRPFKASWSSGAPAPGLRTVGEPVIIASPADTAAADDAGAPWKAPALLDLKVAAPSPSSSPEPGGLLSGSLSPAGDSPLSSFVGKVADFGGTTAAGNLALKSAQDMMKEDDPAASPLAAAPLPQIDMTRLRALMARRGMLGTTGA